MNLKFIGEDGSMGLRHGAVYEVAVYSRLGKPDVSVEWYRGCHAVGKCPYSSPEAFFANWTIPERTQKVVVRKKQSADPVKHGKWVVNEQDVLCSRCNNESGYNAWGANAFSTYCPHCGAKMDLESEGTDE